jgi:hypothetical protein
MKTVSVPVEAAPVGHRVGDELGSMVEAHTGRCAPFGGQGLEAGNHAIGVDGALDVDDVEQLERPSVGCLVELEVEGPHDVGPYRAEGPDGHPDATQRAFALAIGHTQAFCDPQPVNALVVGPPACVPGRSGCPSPAPAGTPAGEVAQEGTQGQLLVARNGWGEALGGTGLANHQAGPALRDPELRAESHDGPPAAVRG